MESFTPPILTAPANRPFRVRLVNPDSRHHSDADIGLRATLVLTLNVA